MTPIYWTKQAIRQLDQAGEYITLSNSEEVSTRITTHILENVQRLATFPSYGRPESVSGTRELIVSPFIAAYTVQKKRIVILAIYHGAQRWPEAF